MLRSTLLPIFAIATLFAAPATSQLAPPIRAAFYGFALSDGGSSAGQFCSKVSGAFSCTAPQITTVAGRTLTFAIRAPLRTAYILFAGSPSRLCTRLPGFEHSLAVVPQQFLTTGTVNTNDRIRCWGGVGTYSVKVPTGLPRGFALEFQAVLNARNLSGATGAVFTEPVSARI